MSNELMRANKVTVKLVEDLFVADFYRTHKHLVTVKQDETQWKAPEGITKSGERELFRAYVIEHSADYSVEWKPEDMRDASNLRRAVYTSDEELISDAQKMILPELNELVSKCKYPITFGGVTNDDIIALTKTGKGTLLSTMGIDGGKYAKNGNWAWAVVNMTATYKYKGSEFYVPVDIELVSGQLKKPKIGITKFNESIKLEIVASGLATEAELDPPKDIKEAVEIPKTTTKSEPKQEKVVETAPEPVVDAPVPEKKSRKRASKTEGAK